MTPRRAGGKVSGEGSAGSGRVPRGCHRARGMCLALAVVALAATMAGCGGSGPKGAPAPGARPKIVATTSIVGDVVAHVAGDDVAVRVLLPGETDPSSYAPSADDVSATAAADIVFANGAGFEPFLADLAAAARPGALVELAAAVPLRRHEDGETDPFVWLDPQRVSRWVDAIEGALTERDPGRATTYRGNAQRYRLELAALDAMIEDVAAGIPAARRRLVADMAAFGYFAARYGLDDGGAAMGDASSTRAASDVPVEELAAAIAAADVPSVLIAAPANRDRASALASLSGVRLAPVWVVGLSHPGGPAANYLALMRRLATAVEQGLGEAERPTP